MTMQRFVGKVPSERRLRSLVVRGAIASLGLAALSTVQSADAALPEGTSICQYSASEGWCKNEQFRQCPGKLDACTTILQSGFQSAYASGVDRPRYQFLDDSNAIVAGKTQLQSLADSQVSIPTWLQSYAGIEARWQSYAQRASVTPSGYYSRVSSWTDSKAINSCQEYVYEKYYDYMRFVDAANSCKQDERCVADMAFGKGYLLGLWPSNIADRTLTGRGTSGPVPLDPIPLTEGVVPKNGFYLGAVLLAPRVRQVLEATYPSWKPALDDAVARAYAGKNYYKWGSPSVYGVPPVKTYANEFAFHGAMRTATQNVSIAETRANFKRTEHFEKQFADWAAAAYCHGLNGAINCVNLPTLRQQGVLEKIGGDPWIRTHILASNALRGKAISLALEGRAVQLDAVGSQVLSVEFPGLSSTIGTIETTTINGGIGSNVITNPILTEGQPLDPTIVFGTSDPALDPTPLWADGIGLDLQNEWTLDPPAAQAGSATPRLDCAVEASKSTYRLLACQATNAILDEIARDNASCFDKGYAGCDWSPAMFADRFHRAQKYMTERARDYESCMRWTANAFSSIPADAKSSFQKLETYIDQQRDAFNDFPAPRVLKSDGRVSSFGQSKSESVTLGKKDSFGGGYSYLSAWKSTPVARNTNNTICRMDFTADAEFKAWGSAFGVARDFVDIGAHLRANVNDDGAATFNRHLTLTALDGSQAVLLPEGTVGINLALGQSPPPDLIGTEEDVTIFTGTYPLPYGFYVDIEAGVELSAGAFFTTAAQVPAKQACTGTGQPLTVFAMLTPYANASLYGSATGGWMGIIEAGLEAELDLLQASVPIQAYGGVKGGTTPKLFYDLEGKLRLKTLSGRIEACGCFLVFCGCTEVHSWPGIEVATTDLFEPVHGEANLSVF